VKPTQFFLLLMLALGIVQGQMASNESNTSMTTLIANDTLYLSLNLTGCNGTQLQVTITGPQNFTYNETLNRTFATQEYNLSLFGNYTAQANISSCNLSMSSNISFIMPAVGKAYVAATDKREYIPREPVQIYSNRSLVLVTDPRNVTFLVNSTFTETRVQGNYSVSSNDTGQKLAEFTVVDPYTYSIAVHSIRDTLYLELNSTYRLYYNGSVQVMSVVPAIMPSLQIMIEDPTGSNVTLKPYISGGNLLSQYTTSVIGNHTIHIIFRIDDNDYSYNATAFLNATQALYLEAGKEAYLPLEPVIIRTNSGNVSWIDPNGEIQYATAAGNIATIADTRIIGNYTISAGNLSIVINVQPQYNISTVLAEIGGRIQINTTAYRSVYDNGTIVEEVVEHATVNHTLTDQQGNVMTLVPGFMNGTYTAEAYAPAVGNYTAQTFFTDGLIMDIQYKNFTVAEVIFNFTSENVSDANVTVVNITNATEANQPIMTNITADNFTQANITSANFTLSVSKSAYLPNEPIAINTTLGNLTWILPNGTAIFVSNRTITTTAIGLHRLATANDSVNFTIGPGYLARSDIAVNGTLVTFSTDILEIWYNGNFTINASVNHTIADPDGGVLELIALRANSSYTAEFTAALSGSYSASTYAAFEGRQAVLQQNFTVAVPPARNTTLSVDKETYLPREPVHVQTNAQSIYWSSPGGDIWLEDAINGTAIIRETGETGDYLVYTGDKNATFSVAMPFIVKSSIAIDEGYAVFNTSAVGRVYDTITGQPAEQSLTTGVNITHALTDSLGNSIEAVPYMQNNTFMAQVALLPGNYTYSTIVVLGQNATLFAGNFTVTEAIAFNLSSIDNFNINNTLVAEKIVVSLNISQEAASVGQPVVWSTSIEEASAIIIPGDAENVSISAGGHSLNYNISIQNTTITKEEHDRIVERKVLERRLDKVETEIGYAGLIKSVGLRVEQYSIGADIAQLAKNSPALDADNLTVLLAGIADNISLRFATAPPGMEMNMTSNMSNIIYNTKVYSNSTLHYTNVSTEVDIAEARPEQVKIYWLINGSRFNAINDPRFNVTLIDRNGNGLIDAVTWITPRLSEQFFEIVIELTVINVHSKPTLYRNWTVEFNTTGQANLTITAIGQTTWSEFLFDLGGTGDDLHYLDLYCGETEMSSGLYIVTNESTIAYTDLIPADTYRVQSLIFPGWECSQPAHLENQIITTGRHDLMFEFDNDIAYAENMGYLLYENFNSYANESDPTDFADYNRTGPDIYPVTDIFSTYFSPTAESYYRVDTKGNNYYYSEYDEANVFNGAWADYEVRTKLRKVVDKGTSGNGIVVYSQIGDGDANEYYLYIRSMEGDLNGNYRVYGNEESDFLCAGGKLNTSISPALNEWYNIRSRVTTEAANVRIVAKVWNDSVAEPASWQINTTCFPAGIDQLKNGTVGVWARSSTTDFDYLIVENITSIPVITIQSPTTSTYSLGQNIWFNMTVDKTGKNCSYVVDSALSNLTKVNDTFFYDNQSFVTYGLRTVTFYCEDTFGNEGNASVSFNVGSGRVSITSPLNATITDYSPLLNAVFNDTYPAWYRIDSNPASSQYGPDDNLTLYIGPLTQAAHKVWVYVNDSGTIDNNSVSFAIDVPNPDVSLVLDAGNPKYTPDLLVDAGIYGKFVYEYRLSCNNLLWSGWTASSGADPYWQAGFNISDSSIGCNASPGIKYVYMQARNYYNETSSVVNDSIIYDSFTIPGNSFTDYFKNTSYIDSYDNLTISATTVGGTRLESGCINYPLEAGCWLYRYHLQVTEENGIGYSGGIEYSINLDTADLIYNSKMNATCKDIRVAKLNDASAIENIDFWFYNASCNSSNTEIWINLSLDAYDTEDIYVYYGNPLASESSRINGSAVFTLFDDFNDGSIDSSKWVNTAGFTESGGELHGTNTNNRLLSRMNFTGRYILETRHISRAPEANNGHQAAGWYASTTNGYNTLLHVNTWYMRNDAAWPNKGGLTYQDNWMKLKVEGFGTSSTAEIYLEPSKTTFSTTDSNSGLNSESVALGTRNDGAFLGQAYTGDWDWLLVRRETPEFAVTVEEEADYTPTGYTESIDIKPAGKKSWKQLKMSHLIPEGTTARYYIMDNLSNVLCQFNGVEDIKTYDISGCAYDYEAIVVRIEILTDDVSYSPTVYSWTVSWTTATDITLIEPTEIYHDWFDTFLANATLANDQDNCSVDAYLEYKLSAQLSEFVEQDYDDFITYSDKYRVSVSDVLKLAANESSGNLLDQGWSRRYTLNVSANETRTQYPVRFEITSSEIDFSDTDFTDIRFTYYNATADEETVIPHWLESYNSTVAYLWAKVPRLVTSDSTIYLYYGNENADDTSNGTAVFLFFDDFEGDFLDSTKWYSAGSVDVSGGIISLNPGKIQSVQALPDQVVVEDLSRVASTSYSVTGHITMGLMDSDQADGMGFWGFYSNTNVWHQYWRNFGWSSISASGSWTTGQWYRHTVSRNGRQFSWSVDGVPRYTGTHPAVPGASTYLHAPRVWSEYANGDGPIEFEWVLARPIESDITISKLGENISYYPYGNYTSSTLDTGSATISYGDITWTGTADSRISIATRTSDDEVYWNAWETQQNGEQITSEGKRYLQYRLQMNATSLDQSPYLDSISIEYSTASQSFEGITGAGVTVSAANPYNCGVMADGDNCNPEWANVQPKDRGVFELRVHANSSNCEYSKYSNVKTIYVFANSEIIGLAASQNPAARNTTTTITGTLQDELGTALENKEIRLYDGSTYLGMATTLGSGGFSYDYLIPESATLGNHNLRAEFRKDYSYFYNGDNASTIVKVSSQPEIHAINISPNPAGNFEQVQINATATDDVGLAKVVAKITLPEGSSTSVQMTPIGGGVSTANYADTWQVGVYIVQIIANNTDGISSYKLSNFNVKIEGFSQLGLNKGHYRNYEDVEMSTPPGWWDEDWQYRRPVEFSVTASPTPDDYQVKLELDNTTMGDNFDWGMECNDLRFINPTTLAELPYWIQECNATTGEAVIWIKTEDNVTDSAYTVDMYYGNAAAANASNGTAVFEFFDGFVGAAIDTGKWTVVDATGWSVSNGQLRGSSTTGRLSTVSTFTAPIVLETRLRTVSRAANGQMSAGFWLTSANGFGLLEHAGGTPSRFWYRDDGGWVGPTDFNTLDSLHLVRITADAANNAEIYIEDLENSNSLAVSNSNTISNEPVTIGRRYDNGNTGQAYDSRWDYILIRKYATEEPTASVGIELTSTIGFANTGTTAIKGYRWAIVQRWSGTAWEDINPAIINDIAYDDIKTVPPATLLDLQTEWNVAPWNTGTEPPGWYRVKITLVKNTTTPQSPSAVIVDSNGIRLESFYNFTVIEGGLGLTDLTHYHLHDYGLNEYEATDSISWINISVKAINNTAFDSNVTLTLLDEIGLDYAGFGPDHELIGFGEILFNTTKIRKWDNSTSGYYIPSDAVSSTYALNWSVNMTLRNGPASINATKYVQIHNLPSNISTNALKRLYIDEYVFYNLSLYNPWSKNLTSAAITLNCPAIAGLYCNCSGSASNTCYLGNVGNMSQAISAFNISASLLTPTGDYKINFTVNYTNPAMNNKSWTDVKNAVLEIRDRGILEIFDQYHNATAIRNGFAHFYVYANNTNGTAPAANASLNYTAVPYNWTNVTGGLDASASLLNPGEIIWNNITFQIGSEALLGPQTVTVNSSSDDVKPDFKILPITVYANTSFSQYYSNDTNASRGETVKLTATLLWDNGTGLSGETVYFYDQTADILIGSAVTNSAGTASKNYAIAAGASIGLHTLNVTYSGKATKYTLPSNRTGYIDIGAKPVVNSIYDSPDPLGYGFNVTITANITDDDEIDLAKVYMTYPDSSTAILNMTEVAPDIYQSNFTDTWFNGTYSYYIRANDTTGSKVKSGTGSFKVEFEGDFYLFTNKSEYSQFQNVTLSSPDIAFTWWNRSWKFKQEINLTMSAGTTARNYQVQVNLTSTNVGPSFDWDTQCEDIRFVNGTEESELDYFIESCNSSGKTATIWIEVDNNISSSYVIYMYYGNSGAANESDAANVFELYDDFNDGTVSATVWPTQVLGTYIVESGGELHVGRADRDFYIQSKSFNVSALPLRVEARTKTVTASANGWSPIMWWQSANEGASILDHNTVQYTRDDATWTQRGARPINEWHRNILMLDSTTTWTAEVLYEDSPGSSWSAGMANTFTGNYYFTVGPRHDWTDYNQNQDGRIDWVMVRKYSAVEPTATLGREYNYIPFSQDIRGHLMMVVQKYSAGSWDNVSVHVNDYPATMTSTTSQFLNLSEIWNPSPWNTGNSVAGLYRIYAYMLTPYSHKINTMYGPLESHANFTVLPPAVNATISLIRVYEVDASTRSSGGALSDSGLNKVFTLFVNKSYRIEIETINNIGSNDWNLGNVTATHNGLNPLWYMSSNSDLWYKIGAGVKKYNGSFNGTVKWNTSANDGTATANTKVTFYYAFNATDGTTGDYPVDFSIIDPTFVKFDNSTYHVVVESSEPPGIYSGFYGMTLSEVIRTKNTTKIYARWNQDIDEAKVLYNATVPGVIEQAITLPSPNLMNWSNHTFNPTASWLLGKHVAQIRASNPSGIWNNSLKYLNFSIFGLAYVKAFSLNTTVSELRENVSITCNIEDDTNDVGIQNYNVTIYSNGALINWSLTNSSGNVKYIYQPPSFGIYSVTCNISEQGWYKTDSRHVDSASLFVMEYEPPKYFNVAGPVLAHKTDTVILSARWTDNAQLVAAKLATNASGAMANVSTLALSGNESWANFSYFIPAAFGPGYRGWWQSANDTSDNYNKTPLQTIEVWGWADIGDAAVDPSSINPGNYTNITCRVIDSDSSVPIAGYNVTFYRQTTYLGWNITNATGYARHEWSEAALGLHEIFCNISDDATLMYNASSSSGSDSLLVTNSPDLVKPFLLVYGTNATTLKRNQCLFVYGQWSEQINASKAYYNITVAMNSSSIAPPYASNWTNTSICTGNSWSVGRHVVRLWANDSAGNFNNSVSYLKFNMTGRSKVKWESPNGTLNRGVTKLTCNVSDYNTGEGVANYRVLFYGPAGVGYLGFNFTNAAGQATLMEDTSGYSTGSHDFFCQIADAASLYYKGYMKTSYGVLIFSDAPNVTINKPAEGARQYRGQAYGLNATSQLDNGTPVTIANATWMNASNATLATGAISTWTVPALHPIGSHAIKVEAAMPGHENGTDQNSIEIWAWARLNQSYLTPTETTLSQPFTMGCQAIEHNSSIPFAGLNVTFATDSNGTIGWKMTNASGWTSFTWSFANATVENITCTIAQQQFINATGGSLNETISVFGTDIATENIVLPVNNTCSHYGKDVVANISNLGGTLENISVSLYINSELNDTQTINMTPTSSKLVNFTGVLFYQGRYNVLVSASHANDSLRSNNNKTAVFDKYLANVSLWTEISGSSETLYNATVNIRNNNNCSIDNISYFLHLPGEFGLEYYSIQFNESRSLGIGNSYRWEKDLAALEKQSLDATINATVDYYVREIIAGVDP